MRVLLILLRSGARRVVVVRVMMHVGLSGGTSGELTILRGAVVVVVVTLGVPYGGIEGVGNLSIGVADSDVRYDPRSSNAEEDECDKRLGKMHGE